MTGAGSSGAAQPRVLMSAYQCGPGMGSVSQIGWEWYARMSRRLPVTLVTHVRNRAALTEHGAPLPGSDIVYIDTEWFAGPLYRLASRLFRNSEHAVFMMSSLDFFVYDHAALRTLRRIRREGRQWDILHCPTPVSPSAATRLHRLGIPMVLGPLNGGLKSPGGFPELLRQDSAWLYPLRNIGRLIDRLTGTTRHAARILVATRATRDWYPQRYRDRCIAMLENAVDLDRFEAAPWPEAPGPEQPLRIVFVGRLVPFKALPYLFAAMVRLRNEVNATLTVVGDGPMRASWEREAHELGLGRAVEFAGARSLDEVAEFMRKAHVFCLPSVRESGGAVLLEAMACARPVIAVDYGGPAEIVDDRVGRKVSPVDADSVIEGITAALQDVCRDPEGWRRRGLQGRERIAASFSWEARMDAAEDIYRDTVERTVGSATTGNHE